MIPPIAELREVARELHAIDQRLYGLSERDLLELPGQLRALAERVKGLLHRHRVGADYPVSSPAKVITFYPDLPRAARTAAEDTRLPQG